MPEPRRTPWIAIDVDIRKDDRIAEADIEQAVHARLLGMRRTQWAVRQLRLPSGQRPDVWQVRA